MTFDAGRPWEIDPDSMELLTPMGRKQEWLSIFPELMEKTIFPVVSSPAHPVCEIPAQQGIDPIDQVFSLNYSVAYKGKFRKPFDRLMNSLSRKLYQNAGRTWRNRISGFTDLVCYDFSTEQPNLRRWELVVGGQHPLVGEQSLHQVCITQNHIIFGDTAFRIEFSQLFFSFIFGLAMAIAFIAGILEPKRLRMTMQPLSIPRIQRRTYCNVKIGKRTKRSLRSCHRFAIILLPKRWSMRLNKTLSYGTRSSAKYSCNCLWMNRNLPPTC
ncbi:hypothetical protein [Leptolyngbya sp. DQ-M1]|uniref:hypothetical protein n=1 Tax=Leptolyngbya sp. DQ-M1 TaxID=2933920 RepID=UPI0032979A50